MIPCDSISYFYDLKNINSIVKKQSTILFNRLERVGFKIKAFDAKTKQQLFSKWKHGEQASSAGEK